MPFKSARKDEQSKMHKMPCYLLILPPLVLLVTVPRFSFGEINFGYAHPYDWPIYYPSCGGSRQSPIDINPYKVIQATSKQLLQLTCHEIPPNKMILKNNGHTAQLSGEWINGSKPMILGGPLKGMYEFVQFHFHWGYDNYVGSEHTFLSGSYVYPLEMHAVYMKQPYKTMEEAVQHPDGLAVIAYLFRITYDNSYSNTGLQLITSAFPYIVSSGQQVNLNPFPLSLFGRNAANEGYFSYLGSLTTPPCNEAVIWMVSYQVTPVSINQLQAFHQLTLKNHDDHNYRPTQPLNGRRVYFYNGYIYG